MSKWMDRADALKIYLLAADIDGLEVTVRRQFDVVAEVEAKFGKATGMVALIAWLGGDNAERKSKELRLGANYSVSVWAREDLLPDDADPYHVAEQLAERMHGWEENPHGSALHPKRLEVTTLAIVPDPKFLIIEIRAEVRRL